MNSSLPASFITLRKSSTWAILGHKIPPILLKSCKVIIITKMDVPVFIHFLQRSSGEDFFAVDGNKKKKQQTNQRPGEFDKVQDSAA